MPKTPSPTRAPGRDLPGADIIFREGFPTKDGRAELVPTDLVAAGRDAGCGVPAGAHHRPPPGALAHRRHDPALAALEAQEPEAIVAMHPREIGERGLPPGQKVRVETRRGANLPDRCGPTVTSRAG